MRFHLEMEIAQARSSAASTARGARAGGAPELRRRREVQGGVPRRPRCRPSRDDPPGRPLRPARPAPQPGLRRRGARHARPRHRRQRRRSSRVVHGVFLQSLPYGGGERLVRLRAGRARSEPVRDVSFSPPEVSDYAAQTRTLEGVAEYHSMWFILLRRAGARARPDRASSPRTSSDVSGSSRCSAAPSAPAKTRPEPSPCCSSPTTTGAAATAAIRRSSAARSR